MNSERSECGSEDSVVSLGKHRSCHLICTLDQELSVTSKLKKDINNWFQFRWQFKQWDSEWIESIRKKYKEEHLENTKMQRPGYGKGWVPWTMVIERKAGVATTRSVKRKCTFKKKWIVSQDLKAQVVDTNLVIWK